MRGSLRSTDTVCRWDGEEFVLICQGMEGDGIRQFFPKLLDAVSDLGYECDGVLTRSNLTISTDASIFSEFDKDIFKVIKRANSALYQAKERGKNQVFVFDDAITDAQSY